MTKEFVSAVDEMYDHFGKQEKATKLATAGGDLYTKA
jgi:hypothetical protein